MRPTITQHDRLIRFATAFDADEETVAIDVPEDLSGLSDEDLAGLQTAALEAFDAVYGDGTNPSEEDVQTLDTLATAIERVQSEQTARTAQAEERQAAAAAVAARVRGDTDGEDGDGSEDDDPALDVGPADAADADPEVVPEPVTASAAAPIHIRVPGRPRRRGPVDPAPSPTSLSLTAASGLGSGIGGGDILTIQDAGAAIAQKASSFPTADQLANAASAGRQLRGGFAVGTVTRGIPSELMASSDTAQDVMGLATDESRLPGGSLVAAGGWCSPSETLYDLLPSLAGTDGLLSIPEFGVSRGGVRYFPDPSFADMYAELGFQFTEEDDADGDYDGDDGPKPCFKVPCVDPVEKRLDVVGLCITAGILQNRAFPELTSRTVAEALTAHLHRIDAYTISQIQAGSTAVSMNTLAAGETAGGAAAPFLSAVELQAEHFRNVHRMDRSATVELVVPYWTRGLIRSDLSRRLGTSLERVTDAVITEHLNDRGVSPQWVYGLNPLTGTAANFVQWPNTASFLLYAAGTWTRGTSDIISLEAIYDSTLLGTNDFTALFTEEGVLVAKRRGDSRYVTVPVCPSGVTNAGALLDCQGDIPSSEEVAT